ncbi:cold-shock protein [Erwinia sp. S43]|uniref:cold-shock protein n=1 Tax=Erwinia sp. S43 TaxID=2769339 RepID=UPI0019094FE2|nr:cold-shock protein [Erwinia sp. S43]MBK0031359.1 cold-shock protein [Erwinia sp. S43]
MAENAKGRARWYLGSVLWYGGLNNKTGKENQFGFLKSESRAELFFHKSEIVGSQLPDENSPVLFREGVGKHAKPTAYEVHLLDVATTADKLVDYFSAFGQGEIQFNGWPQREKVITCFVRAWGDDVVSKLIASGIAPYHLLALFQQRRYYPELFEAIASHKDFNDLIALHISPDTLPREFIDKHVEQFAAWMKKWAGNHPAPSPTQSALIETLLKKISLSATLYLAFFNCLPGETLLKHRGSDIDEFIRRSFGQDKMAVEPYIRDAYPRAFASKADWYRHPVFRDFITPCLLKQKMFRKDFSFVSDIESSPELSADPEFFILAKLLPLIGRNDEAAIQSVILHEIWQALLSGRFTVGHPAIFRLFPQCTSLQKRFRHIRLSCEAFHWRAKQADGSTENRFLCRSKVCEEPRVLPDLSKAFVDFSIYDWLAHYGMQYMIVGEPSKRDLPIKLAAWFNRIRELFARLNCRSCGLLMVPNMKYSRVEVTVWDAASNGFIRKPFQAAYRLTVFKCASHGCEQFDISHYINHCIGYKCSEIIDDRDLTEKCDEGRYICASCGSCCTHHREKYGNTGGGETEAVQYERFYGGSPYFNR